MSPVAKAVQAGMHAPFELVFGRKRASFRLGGRERWGIDARRFAGSPELAVSRTPDIIRIRLTQARYPGTDIPADIDCELRKSLVGWKMRLKLAIGEFSAEVPFERWLTGAQTARSPVKLDDTVCHLARGHMSLAGTGEAEFGPDWNLRITGKRVASLDTTHLRADSDKIELALLGTDDPSISNRPASRRTIIVMNRGRRRWTADALPAPESWSYLADGTAFDRITVEAGENKAGEAHRALVAESFADSSRLTVLPPGHEALPLGLSNPRYAAAFDGDNVESGVVAGFAEDGGWYHADGCSLRLGGSPEAAYEVTARNGGIQSFTCAPALLAIVAPMVGALTETVRPPVGTTVDMAAATRPLPGSVRPGTTPPPSSPPGAPLRPGTSTITIQPEAKKSVVAVAGKLSVSVVRPEDLLALKFDFINLMLVSSNGVKLQRATSGQAAYIIVHFPPQNIAEKAFYEAAGSPDNEQCTKPPIPAMMAGTSRLVFRVPDKVSEIPYTLDALLDWKNLQPSLVPAALPPPSFFTRKEVVWIAAPGGAELNLKVYNVKTLKKAPPQTLALARPSGAATLPGPAIAKPAIKRPEDHETSVEMPYRLILSPHQYEGWAHSAKAVSSGGRTELWHTRLGLTSPDGSIDESDSPFRTLRAVWSPDYSSEVKNNHNLADPFRMPISKWQRYQIVGLCSDFTNPNYDPLPVKAEQLMLTSLGAWLKSRGNWNPRKTDFAVCEWKHIAAMGRDHYVKVVEIGYLFPFGHLAVRTWVTERKFEKVGNDVGCYMRQRMFIVVLKPVVEYPPLGAADMWKQLPFKRIRCNTEVTPGLGDPASSAVPTIGKDAFWPIFGTQPFKFDFVAEDWDGHHVQFQAPCIFATLDVAFSRQNCPELRKEYYNPANSKRRVSGIGGQRIAYAESKEPGDTTYETADMTFGGEVIQIWSSQPLVDQMKDQDQPPFYPTLSKANVKVSAVQQLTGTDAPVEITYHPSYTASGLGGSNKGEVVAAITKAVSLSFGGGADKSCGLAAPNMSIGGLSRAFGAVGGVADQIAGGTFDPASFFSDATILGCIPLSNIIRKITDFGSEQLAGMRIPRTTSKPIYKPDNPLPVAIETMFNWKTSEISNDTVTETFLAEGPGGHCTIEVNATKRTALAEGEKSSQSVTAEIRDFTVQLAPKVCHLVDILFNHIRFTAEDGKKPDVKADIAKVVFKGALSFINRLEEYLGGSNFSDPPYLDVNTQRVEAGFTLGIPTVGIGVFSLQNINLGAALRVPFIGEPVSMRFNFCEKQDPFLLTVSLFGGGGYFALELDPKGVRAVEGSLEFGGSFSMNLGVASGGVHLLAAITYQQDSTGTVLSGQLRCGGAIEVLGLITVSLEFLMALKHYDSPYSRLHGVATLTVEIEILFFSTSVDLTVEREFAGGGDPTFAQLMDPGDWNEYCDAFAA